MVNTLSGSVSAYRKEIVKPRFIRIDEVMALLDVTQDEAMDIADLLPELLLRVLHFSGKRRQPRQRSVSKR